MDAIRPYWKSGLAVLVAVLSGLYAALYGDEIVSNTEWVNVAIAGVTAAAVFTAPNVPGARYTKAILAVLGGVLVVLQSSITNGVTSTELVQILLAAAAAVGVGFVPNKPLNTVGDPNRL